MDNKPFDECPKMFGHKHHLKRHKLQKHPQQKQTEYTKHVPENSPVEYKNADIASDTATDEYPCLVGTEQIFALSENV